MPSWKKVIVSGSAASLSSLTTSGNISGSSTSTGSFGRVELGGKSSTNSTISIQDGVHNGILRLQGSTRVSSPGAYIQLYGPNGSYGSAVFNYGYNTTNSELSFHVNGSEKIRFGGHGEIEAKSLTATGNISGSSTSTGSFGSLSLASKVQSNLRIGGSNILYFGDGNNYIQDVGSYLKLRIADGHYFAIHNDSGDTERLRIYDGGQVGIGHTNPTYKLDVLLAGDDQFRVGRSASKYFAIRDDVIRYYGMQSNGMRIVTDNDASIKHGIGKGDFKVDDNTSGHANPRFNVSGSGLVVMSGSIYFNPDPYGYAISGSSTSTGSFGHVKASTSVFTNRIENVAGSSLRIKAPGNDVILDTGDNDIQLHAGGSEFARLTNDSNTLAIKSSTSNADIVLNGVDSGANITALRLDMSEKGKAIFNSDVSGSATSTGSFGRIQATTIAGNSPLNIVSPTLVGDTTVQGSLTATHDIIAQRYIVNSSVTNMTQSFSSGSTIFGDTSDDTHQFTGSLNTTGYVGIMTSQRQAPLHVENGTNGMSIIRLEDARSGDDSITAGGYLDFYTNHISANKHLGRIIYQQAGSGHNAVTFKITGTLAGVGGKKLVTNDDNGIWKFYNNYTEDLALVIKNSKLGVGGIATPAHSLDVSGSAVFADGTNAVHISGSAYSTGSFGQIEFGTNGTKTSINGDGNGIIVGQYGNSSNQGVLTVFGSYAGSILGLATDNNQWVFGPYDNVGLEFRGGSSGTKFKFRPGGGASKSFEITADGDVSGSASSTGSFGHLMIGGSNFTAGDISDDTSWNDGTATRISGSLTSTGSFGSLISRTTYIGEYTPIFNEGANMLVIDSGDAQILSLRRGSGNNQWNFGLSLSGDLSFRERTDDAGSGTTHHIFYKDGYVKFGGNITGSGNLEIAGNISGSSTSTGSFQTIRFGPPGRNFQFYESGNDAYFGGSGLRIGTNFAFRINGGESLSTGGTATITRIDNVSSNIYFAIGGDGGSGDTALLINTENQNYLGLGLRTNSGLNTPDVIKIHDEAGYGGLGANVVEFATGSLVVSSGNISGSVTSTGSFGAGFFDDSVGIGVAPGNSSYMLNIEAAQTYAARFKSRKTTSSSSQRTMIAVGSGQTKGAGIYFSGPSSTNVSIGVKEDNKFHIAPGLNDIGDSSSNSVTVDTSGNLEVLSGNISGSSTSTGSFGNVHVADKLAVQTTTPRGPIDVLGSNGSQGFYVSDTGLKAYLPTDVAHSSGATTFDLQVANLRLGTGAQGPVSIYPRFNSMLQLGTQDDTNLLTLSGSTQISGSSTSTGSFGHTSVIGRGYFKGKLGVGVTEPVYKFESYNDDASSGAFRFIGGSNKTANNTYGVFQANDSSDPFQLSIKSVTNDRFEMQVVEQNVGYKDLVFQNQGGNVGIATTAPSVALEVRKTTTSTVLIASSSATAGNTIAVRSSNGTGAGINFRSEGGHNRGRIWYDGSMTIDNADDAARPVKITTGQGTAASGKDTAIIRVAPSGSTSGYFNAHGGVSIGRNHQRADSSTSTDFILHVSESADHGLLKLEGSKIGGSSTSTGSFGVLQLNGSPLMSGDGDGFGINQTNPTADLHIGNSGVSENVEFLMQGGADIHARFDGSGVFSFRRYNINFQINRHSTSYNGSLSFVNGGTLGSGATQEWRFHLPASDTALKLKDDDDVELIAFTQNKEISGSLASTGSFGRTVSGKFYASSNGAASNPEYSFTDDTDIGMYRHTTNGLGFATNGTARLNINGNGQVAINDTNPQDTLQIDHATGTGGNTLSVNANGVSGKGTLYVEGNASFGANVRVEGDIIAENYIVSSSTTYMTTSFSAGSTRFGDTPSDDTHQFTGSLSVSGSSVKGYSSQPPTAILANPANTGSYGLHVRGYNRGIRLDRYNSTNASAFTNIYQNGSDWTIFTQNINDPLGDPDADITKGIGVNRIGGNFYPQNNSIDFDGYDLKRTRLGQTHLTMGNDVTFSLAYNKSFIVSGSKIEFEPTSEVTMKGDVLPGTDNTHDLGSPSKRWANVHSADLHLSNEDTEGNEVDGTTGNWTIQEGEDDLYLLNNKNGKKYRFKLEEIK